MSTGKTILLVDDDPDFLEMMKAVLESRSYSVICCPDHRAAMERMRDTKPDLIITDLMMENLDAGFSFSRQIKEDPRLERVPVIVVTAVSRQRGFDFKPRTQEELSAMCVDAYFDKPVDPQALLGKIEAILKDASAEHSA